jgi:hypothetical protein
LSVREGKVKAKGDVLIGKELGHITAENLPSVKFESLSLDDKERNLQSLLCFC